MHQCCANPYNVEFDREHAQNDLGDYQLNGPKENSEPLVRIMDNLGISGQTLLDIGGGIGAITFELFKVGIRSAVLVDISSAYVKTFREEAEHRQLSDRTMSYCGDFLDIHQKLDRADIVTLDKVICCYLNYEELVRISVQKTTKWYVIAIPRDLWWVKLVHFTESKWKALKGKHFKSYIHPVSKIEKIIIDEGLHLYTQMTRREWYYAVYKR